MFMHIVIKVLLVIDAVGLLYVLGYMVYLNLMYNRASKALREAVGGSARFCSTLPPSAMKRN